MGIISRFTDIMKANINDLLDKCEDPAKMVDQTLRDLRENLADVKKETAGVMAEEARCERNLDEAQAEVDKWTSYAQKAIKAGNDGDAKEFISKKQKAETKLAGVKQTYDVAHENANKMRQMHNKLVSDIQTLESKKEMIKAKVAVAKTQQKVNEATSRSNISGAMSAFERMEAKADKMLDSANAMAELNAEPMDSADALADKYDNGDVSSSVDAELAAMKASMGL